MRATFEQASVPATTQAHRNDNVIALNGEDAARNIVFKFDWLITIYAGIDLPAFVIGAWVSERMVSFRQRYFKKFA